MKELVLLVLVFNLIGCKSIDISSQPKDQTQRDPAANPDVIVPKLTTTKINPIVEKTIYTKLNSKNCFSSMPELSNYFPPAYGLSLRTESFENYNHPGIDEKSDGKITIRCIFDIGDLFKKNTLSGPRFSGEIKGNQYSIYFRKVEINQMSNFLVALININGQGKLLYESEGLPASFILTGPQNN